MDRVETHIGTVAYRRAGAGAPLVLLHGGLSDGRSWIPQLESLAPEYDVVAWDAPGCGGSADPTADLGLADYADAVAALVRALGVGPVHLAGHSFGAGLAIDVYGRHRQLVRSLVLSGAYAGWRGSLPPAEVEARVSRALADLDRPPAEWVDSYLAEFFGHSVPLATVEAVHAMMLDVRPAGAMSMLTAFADADLRAVLPAIAVPTLLIYGAEDVRAPRGVAEALHTAIRGSRLILVPAAGHDVNLEAPDEYDAAVRAFLRMVGEPGEAPESVARLGVRVEAQLSVTEARTAHPRTAQKWLIRLRLQSCVGLARQRGHAVPVTGQSREESGEEAWPMAVDNMEDFLALEPFFRAIEAGLDGLVEGEHFFDLLADDVVFEFIITVPDYPRRVEGREKLIELYRGYHTVFFLDRCFDLRVHRADDSTVTLEYASEGKSVATGRPYSNRYISVVTIRNRKIVHWRDYLDPLRVFAALRVHGTTEEPA